ncbi:hypothetical protein NEUTE1DRAFT_141182 [Neurospora tetrasperma FGSC 2508]|uniref:Uncharacterized protein n=1 Tax=Neurospora tetrasperma (strain FGSC 2508 / ATCC MYA-4615 / P0657) TaxID=510951 RepID=F8MWB8_NEUT8|nr:uncharacterized protein NEUTE1DRAFT_141182 [Neurospora tetrasperma FGSC 2508]EGO54913.1 hypothetical protein NEUTE1DRAFT_141182 [Neurospora tetrasperma FGSC 2508]
MADRIGAPTPNFMLTERDSLPNNRPLGKLCSEWKHCTKPSEIVILLQAGAANVTGLNSDLGLASHLVLGHMPKAILERSDKYADRVQVFVVGNAIGAGTIAGPKPGHEGDRINIKSWRGRRSKRRRRT